MKGYEKYTRQYFEPHGVYLDWAKRSYIDKAPAWCSVDLRDGNQALVVPMSLNEKLDFFKLLVEIGFKEIEIGFPAASETEYEFCRALIERGLIPEDVTVQVLTQAREHIIKKTFEALRGAKKACVHLYNSTSVAQRQQVFKKSKAEIVELAVRGAKLLKEYGEAQNDGFMFEYSPESFTGTEPDFALEICNRVIGVMQPAKDKKLILNLPVTVSHSMPHIYASQVEYMCKNLDRRDCVIVSLHPHNDRGCAVADSEMGLIAGAQRIEGTLFGNGERTGNVDIITLALNMYSQGVDPGLDLSDLPSITHAYERFTGMRVFERQPYSGQLVFAAFSGSHQDAIAKGMKWREQHEDGFWNVPYLPIDPKDVGREYETDVIRINSQSGKGGIGYILETRFSFALPPKMRESFGYSVKAESDHRHREFSPEEVFELFKQKYVNIERRLSITESSFSKTALGITAKVTAQFDGREYKVEADGNGRLDAVSNAIKKVVGESYRLESYTEHAIGGKSDATAASYVAISTPESELVWGVGVHSDIIESSIKALVSAVNNMIGDK